MARTVRPVTDRLDGSDRDEAEAVAAAAAVAAARPGGPAAIPDPAAAPDVVTDPAPGTPLSELSGVAYTSAVIARRDVPALVAIAEAAGVLLAAGVSVPQRRTSADALARFLAAVINE